MPNGQLNRTVDMVDAEFGWMVGTYGNIIRTTDSGATWHIQLSDNSMHCYDVSFANRLVGYATVRGNLTTASYPTKLPMAVSCGSISPETMLRNSSLLTL